MNNVLQYLEKEAHDASMQAYLSQTPSDRWYHSGREDALKLAIRLLLEASS